MSFLYAKNTICFMLDNYLRSRNTNSKWDRHLVKLFMFIRVAIIVFNFYKLRKCAKDINVIADGKVPKLQELVKDIKIIENGVQGLPSELQERSEKTNAICMNATDENAIDNSVKAKKAIDNGVEGMSRLSTTTPKIQQAAKETIENGFKTSPTGLSKIRQPVKDMKLIKNSVKSSPSATRLLELKKPGKETIDNNINVTARDGRLKLRALLDLCEDYRLNIVRDLLDLILYLEKEKFLSLRNESLVGIFGLVSCLIGVYQIC